MTTYRLAYTNGEHERLMRQAQRLAPMTERSLRDAGIREGWRVLELGSGVGDVSMLLANLVGPSGEVIGVERDERSIARARERAAQVGFRNIQYWHADVRRITESQQFDAVVGRCILQWLPDPLSLLKNVVALVRQGGVVAFQEISWTANLAYAVRLPLVWQVMQTVYEALRRQGVHVEMGFDLHRYFQSAGLPAPVMRLEISIGSDPAMANALVDLLRSIEPTTTALGDLDTLSERILRQADRARTVLTMNPIVCAWAVRP